MAVVIEPTAGSSRSHPPISILKRSQVDLPIAQVHFQRKTARGKVQNGSSPALSAPSENRLTPVVRERYVRDDIPCGFERCEECARFPGYRPVLPRKGITQQMKLVSPNGHYLVVDTNIVLHQVSSSKRIRSTAYTVRWICWRPCRCAFP